MSLIDAAAAVAQSCVPSGPDAETLPSCAPSATVPPVSGFESLGVGPAVLKALADLGFTEPTPVQSRVIPVALPVASVTVDEQSAPVPVWRDWMVSSRTGSGKTAAFLIPLIEAMLAQPPAAAGPEGRRGGPKARFQPARPRALVLCPTRELAQQVASDGIDLLRHCKGLRVASVIGGVAYPVQVARLQGASLVVATPGRLLDLQRAGQIDLSEVRQLVLDEADRMLDLGFSDDLEEIHRLCSGRGQTLMFSATFAARVQSLAARLMQSPGRIELDSPQERHESIQQTLHWADHPQHKRSLLDHWLRDVSIDQAIVFASTQIECDELAEDLQQAGYSAVALHGALSQGLRQRRLRSLRDGQVKFLVATDVAARGIDVPTISHVFNFGLPMKAEDYTHRIGRTGRAGRTGVAVTFAESRDIRRVREVESFTRQILPVQVIPGLEPKKPAPGGRPMGGPRGGGRSGSRDGWAPARAAGGGFSGSGAGGARGPRSGGGFEGRGRDGHGFEGRFADGRGDQARGSFDDRRRGGGWGGQPAFDGDRTGSAGGPRGGFRGDRAAPRGAAVSAHSAPRGPQVHERRGPKVHGTTAPRGRKTRD